MNTKEDFMFIGETDNQGELRLKNARKLVDMLNCPITKQLDGIKEGDFVKWYSIHGKDKGFVESISYEVGNFEFPFFVAVEVDTGKNGIVLLSSTRKSFELYCLEKI